MKLVFLLLPTLMFEISSSKKTSNENYHIDNVENINTHSQKH